MPPTTQSKSTGATDAMTSAALHASMYDIAPPFEQPEEWMRLLSTHPWVCSCVMSALTKATSSATVTQHPPAFHPGVLPSPCGNTVMNPSVSPSAAQPERLLCWLGLPPSP